MSVETVVDGTGARTSVRTPLTSFLIKVHSRCNLMCDYCYEYNCGNTSWREKPREMSWVVYTKALDRVLEHMLRHGRQKCFFSFHGGEPLLRSLDFFKRAVETAKVRFEAEGLSIEFGMQSNVTLLTPEGAATLAELGIGIGISLDGPAEAHNEFRVFADGRPSYDETLAGLKCLLTPIGRKIWGGFLTVINVKRDPVEIFEHLAGFEPPSTDFLEPHASWQKLPAGKSSPDDVSYGDWLIRLFDHWFDSERAKIPIRKFDEIIEHIYGGAGSLESFGLEPVDLLTIATDGAYEAVDCIKAAHPTAEKLGLNIFDHDLDQVLAHPMINIRQIGLDALSEVCRDCGLVAVCGGGYFAHRYSQENGFRNPSIYCADYRKLIGHILNRLPASVKG